MDKYDLYGKMAIPKRHDIENEVALIYQYCANKRGVFTNICLHENFGLTTIEAGGTGLPVVIAEDPLSCVALGTGKALDEEQTFSTMLIGN